jgi:hypothetical protein
MWPPSWEEVDELEWPTHYHGKTMVTTPVNGTAKYLLNLLPGSQSMRELEQSGFRSSQCRRITFIKPVLHYPVPLSAAA